MPPAPTTPPPPHARLAVPVLLLVVFLSLIGFGVVIPLLPFYASVFDASPWEVTLMFAAFSGGQFLGELTWGRLSDRLGRRPVLIGTILASSIGYVALAFAPSIWIAILIRAIGGVFSGNIAVIQGYIVDVTPPERIAGRLGLIGGAFGVGFVVGPWLGGALARPELGAAGFHPPLLVAAGMCLVAAVGVAAFVRESLRRDAPAVSKPGPLTAIREAWADPVLRRLTSMTFVAFVSFSAMWAILGLWGEARFGWGPREIGFVMGLTGIAAAVSQGLFSGMLVRRIGEVTTIILGFTATCICLLVQAASPYIWLCVAAMVVATSGHTMAQPATSALISRAAPPGRQGAILGANNAAGSAARVAGPMIAGVMFSSVSNWAPIVFAGLGMLPAAWLAWRAGRQLRLKAKAA
jgi:DHA1 family tetracycline resistance protein-like MFS transporter